MNDGFIAISMPEGNSIDRRSFANIAYALLDLPTVAVFISAVCCSIGTGHSTNVAAMVSSDAFLMQTTILPEVAMLIFFQ